MKYLLIMLLLNLCFSVRKSVDWRFPQMRSIDSIPASDQLIVEYIDFDFQHFVDSVDTISSLRSAAFDQYRRLKNLSDISRYETTAREDSIVALSAEKAVEKYLLQDEKRVYSEGLLLNFFSGKDYIDSTPRIKRTAFDSLVQQRNQKIREVAQALTTLDSLPLVPQVSLDDTVYNRVPVALFLGRSGDSFCWIYIVHWGQKSFDRFADEFVSLLDDDEKKKFDIDESVKYVTLGHIEGRVYNFDFTNELASFRCD